MAQRPENPSRQKGGQLISGGRLGYRAAEKAAFVAGLQAARTARTEEQQLLALDARLGVGSGAKRERARLQAAISNRGKVKATVETAASEQPKGKKHQGNLKGKARKQAQAQTQ